MGKSEGIRGLVAMLWALAALTATAVSNHSQRVVAKNPHSTAPISQTSAADGKRQVSRATQVTPKPMARTTPHRPGQDGLP